MNLRKRFTDRSHIFLKAASFQFLPVMLIGGQLFVFWFSRFDHLFPNHDALMQVISCCAQIIAGLYGITLAGYTFFLSRIDALMVTDATLDYIVGSIKQRFKILIWHITWTVAATLFISVFLMYYPIDSNLIPDCLYRVICNEFILFLGSSISLILSCSVGIVNPNSIQKEAQKLKRRLGGRIRIPGSTVEFISLYGRIEQQCNSMLPENVVGQIHENKGRHFEYTIEPLQEQNVLLRPLIADIRRIHRYYECVMNCTPMSVSQEMCFLAGKILTVLEQIASTVPNVS